MTTKTKNENDKEMSQAEFNQLILDKMNRIELAVCGDERAGVTGVVPKIKQHEKRLTVIERVMWSIGGAVTLLSILWAIFTEFH
jgi:hypothetical protein